jgi:hypothetical protein
MKATEAHNHEQASTGLDQRSCAWSDAIGSGYVTGPTERMLDSVSHQAQDGYCPNRAVRASMHTTIAAACITPSNWGPRDIPEAGRLRQW